MIETALARSGYTPVLCTQTPGGVHEDDYVQMLLDRSVAGIIYVSGLHADTTTDPDRYVALRDRGLPIVLVNGYIEGVDAPFISNDDVASMELSIEPPGAARAQPASGWPSGPTATCRSSARSPGFRNAMSDHARPGRRRGPHRAHDVHRRGRCRRGQPADRQGRDRDRLRLRPDGARRDPGGPPARVCEVPRDFSVVGYDDSTLIAFTDPPLTTVRQSVQAMGEAAVRALIDEIAGRAGAPGGVRLPPRARGPRLHRRRARAGPADGAVPQAPLPVAPHGSPRSPEPQPRAGLYGGQAV